MHSALPLESIIAVGFGSANCTKDNEFVYDEQDTPDGGDYATCGDMEKLAAADPDHDWQIAFYAPLYEAVYQRHGNNHWVLIQKGNGFA
jgi:hypothetical protein